MQTNATRVRLLLVLISVVALGASIYRQQQWQGQQIWRLRDELGYSVGQNHLLKVQIGKLRGENERLSAENADLKLMWKDHARYIHPSNMQKAIDQGLIVPKGRDNAGH